MSTPTQKAFVAYERKSDALDKIHDCQIANWSGRLSSPGFSETHIGMSRWVCETCRPMVAEMVDELYGGHDFTAATPKGRAS